MTAPRSAEPPDDELTRLAVLHGVATSYSPSPGRTVAASAAAVVAALAALDVDASTPEATRAALTAREGHLAQRLLPPTVVCWNDDGPGSRDTDVPGGHDTGDIGDTGDLDREAGARYRGTQGRDTGASDRGTGVQEADVSSTARRPDKGSPGRETSLAAVLSGLPPGTRLRVETEQGETRSTVDRDLPPGVHRLTATAPDGRTGEAHLIVAPPRLPTPSGRTYGLLVQLYSLLSHRSWGMGDLGDLAELSAWAGRSLGAGFVQVNPLHAGVPGAPTDPSPYRPSSRRFPDPVHLRVEDVPEFAYVTDDADRERLRALLERAERLRAAVLGKGALIDRDAVWELKREALEPVLRVPLGPGRRAAYADFLAREGQALEDHATWCALAEVHGSDWSRWPEGLRDPRSAETARARAALMDRVDFHSRLAWLTDAQLAAAQRTARESGMPIG
ncbi:4-alpha-glucanotransferase, partial [Streptomyces spiralis]